MIPVDFQVPTRIVFGAGKISSLGALAQELAATTATFHADRSQQPLWRRALVVSDPGVVAAGHTASGLASLEAAQFETRLFDGARENPTTEHVTAGVSVARDFQPDVIVGLGGGSSMDCAKGINFVYSCGGTMRDYWGRDKATGPLLPMIAVPTTAGTGSETQSFALISDAETHEKMACGDRRAAFRLAILDPELTATQPALVTALTGIDAMAHALETAVTTRRNELSLALSLAAWRQLAPNYAQVIREPRNMDARASMQLGAALAGMAIESSMLGAAHALANPLTATYQIAHGQAIALMLPHVVRLNGRQHADLYAPLANVLVEANLVASPTDGPQALAEFMSSMARTGGLAVRLSECGVAPDSLDALAESAAAQWTAQFNPVTVDARLLAEIYEQAL